MYQQSAYVALNADRTLTRALSLCPAARGTKRESLSHSSNWCRLQAVSTDAADDFCCSFLWNYKLSNSDRRSPKQWRIKMEIKTIQVAFQLWFRQTNSIRIDNQMKSFNWNSCASASVGLWRIAWFLIHLSIELDPKRKRMHIITFHVCNLDVISLQRENEPLRFNSAASNIQCTAVLFCSDDDTSYKRYSLFSFSLRIAAFIGSLRDRRVFLFAFGFLVHLALFERC